MSNYNSTFTGEEIDNAIEAVINGANMIKGTSLASGTDLNTLFIPGWYYGLGTTSYTNRPVASRNFILGVFPSADGSSTGSRVGQIFMTTGYTSTASTAYPSALYIRGVRRTVNTSTGAYSYTHTGWLRLATNTDINSLSDRIDSIEESGEPTQVATGTFTLANSGSSTATIDFDFVPTMIKVWVNDATAASSTGRAIGCLAAVLPYSGSGSSFTNPPLNNVQGYMANNGMTWGASGYKGSYLYEAYR